MALKGQPISLGTSDTTVYTCPVSTEASVHGLVIGNNTGSAATFTLKVYIQSTGLTTTVATGISVAANSTYTWPKPIDVNAGDIIKIAASSLTTLVALYSVYEGSNPPVAVGFTPRGAWSSGATYATNDTVSYTNGNSYVAIQASTNQQPDTQTAYWQVLAERGATGSGDVTGPVASVDSELALYSSTTGKVIKRATLTGLVKATSGVASAATAGTDYLAPPSGTAILKANSGGALANATAGTDYLAPPSGTAILKANSSGALANATAGTDYVAPGGALGTPSSGTLTNCTSIPVNQATGTLPVANGGTGITSFGTGVATWLGSPSSANLASAITDETGSGSLVFGTNPTITNYTEAVVAIGNSGTSKTLDLTNGTVQTVTMTGNCTFAMPTAAAGKSFVLIVSSGAGSFTGTFTSVKWPSNTAPTLTTSATRWDILSFFSDGTNWYGSFVQAFQ